MYTPLKPYIKEIYRLINLISHCHTVVRTISGYLLGGYLDVTQEKTIKIKANDAIENKFYRPRIYITKQIALFCTKKALIHR